MESELCLTDSVQYSDLQEPSFVLKKEALLAGTNEQGSRNDETGPEMDYEQVLQDFVVLPPFFAGAFFAAVFAAGFLAAVFLVAVFFASVFFAVVFVAAFVAILPPFLLSNP